MENVVQLGCMLLSGIWGANISSPSASPLGQSKQLHHVLPKAGRQRPWDETSILPPKADLPQVFCLSDRTLADRVGKRRAVPLQSWHHPEGMVITVGHQK